MSLLMMDWSKRGNIDTAALVTIVQCKVMTCVILYVLSCLADIVQSSIRAAIQVKPLLKQIQ